MAKQLTTGEPADQTAAKLAFLRSPAHYPEGTDRVEVLETHMSWVFLTDRHVYKLKKPVRYSFLDFSTPEARRRDSEAELRLNRRLAEPVYIAVVPLTRDPQGGLHIGGNGPAVDWLVKMHRLPAERMLDHAIAQGTVVEDDVRRFAARLAHFYVGAAPIGISAADYRARFVADIEANGRELTRHGLPANAVHEVSEAQLRFVRERGALLDARVAAGRIIEAHGDLRPEHICLTPEPMFIDCLEFKREFRILDAADELAFLAMECERLGASFVGRVVFDTYAEVSGDRPAPVLIAFYKAFRATLRAKIAIWHTLDHDVREHAKWVARAGEYLRMAQGYCGALTSPE